MTRRRKVVEPEADEDMLPEGIGPIGDAEPAEADGENEIDAALLDEAEARRLPPITEEILDRARGFTRKRNAGLRSLATKRIKVFF